MHILHLILRSGGAECFRLWAQLRLDGGEDGGEAIGFGDVGIGAGGLAALGVATHRLGCDGNDRHGGEGRIAVRAQLPDRLHAIQKWHPHVHEDQGGRQGVGLFNGLQAIARHLDRIAMQRQVFGQGFGAEGVVFGQEEERAGAGRRDGPEGLRG